MPATDDFKSYAPGPEGPILSAAAIVPADGSDLPRLTRALYVGTAGDVRIGFRDGTVVTFRNMAAGWHPLRIARLHATGTTAADLVGGW